MSNIEVVAEAHGLQQIENSLLQAQEDYVHDVVTAAMTEDDIKPSTPGFHAIKFVAERAVRMVLNDAATDEAANRPPTIEGEQ